MAGHKDIRTGDIIETYTTEQLADELGRNSAELRKETKVEKDRLAAAPANNPRESAPAYRTHTKQKGRDNGPALL